MKKASVFILLLIALTQPYVVFCQAIDDSLKTVSGNPSATPAKSHENKLEFPGFVLSDSLEYSAESIDYLFDNRQVIMNTNAAIKYMGRVLKSNTIHYFQNYQFMEAVGIKDSTGSLVKTPTFTDVGGEVLEGREIKYSLKSEKGLVNIGKTEYEKGFMTAHIIKRASEDTLFISDGTYTTCDLEHPHYYFAGKRMKFILNDKLIIKPVVAYVHDIPVMWFPFYVFPIAKGRQSGFLTPRYGFSRIDGRYFSNIGYYLAPSDYYDYRGAMTLRERNGWLINNWVNYNKRYSISGSLFGSFEDESRKGSRQWQLSGSHRHTISPTLSMTGNINLQSSEYSRNNSPNLYQRMNRNMNSSFRITKKWPKSGNSLIVYVSNSKNLDTKDTSSEMPSLTFTRPQKLLFGTSKTGETNRKYSKKATDTGTAEKRSWYQDIYYSLNASLKNSRRKAVETDKTRDMDVATSLSGSHKFRGWLTANPSLNLNESFIATNDSIGYRRDDNISAGLSLNTKIFGTFKPSIGNLTGLRHVITPSVSYRFGKRREFSGTGADAFYRFDKNDADNGTIKTMSISLRNLLQAKTVNGDKENKFDLFSLDFSTGVDFERKEQAINPLRTEFDIKPLKTLNVRLTASHNFYHDDNTFHLFNPYLNEAGITTTFGLSDATAGFMGRSSRVNANNALGREDFSSDLSETETGEEAVGKTGKAPFSFRFTHYYRVSRGSRISPGEYRYMETHTIKPTITFSPSRNFSLTYDCYYDFKSKTINTHRMLLNRELHCWTAFISWVPSGIREGFYFQVNIKELPDVKIEKSRGVSRFNG